MELEKAIGERRSIRKYKDRKVPVQLLADILEKAKLAPSSGNLQNWFFVVVTDSKKKKEIAEACEKQHWMTTAPIHLVICNDYKRVEDLYEAEGKMFSIQNCSVITAYIMLLAVEQGLATCWVGSFDPEKIRRLIEAPEHIDPEIILTIGHSDDEKISGHQRDDIEHSIFFDKWDNKIYSGDKETLKEKLGKIVKFK